jgi:hypothetical protein
LADRPETESDAIKQADVIFKPQAPVSMPGMTAAAGETSLRSKIVPLKKPVSK